jgi:stress response protein YsnF
LNSQANDKNPFGVRLADQNKSEGIGDANDNDNNELLKSEELVSRIPLYNENFNVTKRVENGILNIEKKWITTNKKIEIPLQHEEIFINGKELDSFDEQEVGNILSQIKSKLSNVFIHEKTELQQEANKNSNESKISIIKLRQKGNATKESEKPLPLSDSSSQTSTTDPSKTTESEKPLPLSDSSSQTSTTDPSKTTENILSEKPLPLSDSSSQTSTTDPYKIELWGEEIIINKRMIKLGEILVRKYEVHENRKIDVEIKREKLTLKFPGNYKEEIL